MLDFAYVSVISTPCTMLSYDTVSTNIENFYWNKEILPYKISYLKKEILKSFFVLRKERDLIFRKMWIFCILLNVNNL